MKNKRVLAALLAASCLAASFTACSGDTSSSSTAESSAASADASSSAAEGSSESTGLMSDEEIIKKAIDKGLFKNGTNVQIIVGTNVHSVYDLLRPILNLED